MTERTDSQVVADWYRWPIVDSQPYSQRSPRGLPPPPQSRPGQTRRETGTQSQGSSRHGRPPGRRGNDVWQTRRSHIVKKYLARFTWAVMLLASMALTVGAGMRWD